MQRQRHAAARTKENKVRRLTHRRLRKGRTALQADSVTVASSAEGRVVTMTLPGGLLETRTAFDVTQTCERLQEDRDIRVLVIASSDEDFCSGVAEDFDRFAVSPDPATALSRLRIPLVASLSGQCSSAGLEIALACDIRIGTPQSRYSLSDSIHGSLPAWGGTQRLPRAITAGRAAAMLFLGTELDAQTAHQWGLIHSIADDAPGEATSIADMLLTRGPLALEMAKEAIRRGSELPLRDGLRLEGDLNHQLAATEDRAEGLAAFFAKRPPDFSGR